MENANNLTFVLRKLRTDAGLTQKQAASKAGLTQSHLSMIENGKRRVSTDLAKKLLELYGISFSPEIARRDNADCIGTALYALGMLSKAGGKQIEDAADRYVCLSIYILLRKLYLANPHNTDKLFRLSSEDAERLAESLIKEPDRLLAFAVQGDDIPNDRLEPSLNEALALREAIEQCEEIAMKALGI